MSEQQSSAVSTEPVAWRVTAGGDSERHLFDEERYAKLMRKDLEENGWLDVEMVPLYAAAPRASADSADDLRSAGWMVAVHNDYRLNGKPHTFWLFTKGDRAIKGEGDTDQEALDQCRALAGTEPQTSTPQEEWVEITDGTTLPGDRFSYISEAGIGQITSHKRRRSQAVSARPVYVKTLEDLVQCLIDNDPEELAADGGVRVIDVWRKDAERTLSRPQCGTSASSPAEAAPSQRPPE